jgi:hypothetical protein
LALLGELGMSAVLARLLVRAWDEARTGPATRRVGWTTIGAAVLVCHGVLAPWWGQRQQAALRVLHTAGAVATATLPLGNDEGPGLRVVVLAAADPMTLLYPPSIRAHAGHPPLQSWWVLSMAASEHDVLRTSANALELRPRTRAIGSGVIAQLFHRAPLSFRPGDRVDVGGMVVEVLETDAQGQVLAARFTFDRPLEDPTLRFVVSTPGGYRRYPLGPIGVPMRLAPQPPPGLQ